MRFALAFLILATPAMGEVCTVIDFSEFEADEIVTESRGVTFEPHEYRTYPSDCVGPACPCDDADLSFPGQGLTLIQQEQNQPVYCSPDDEIAGALFDVALPFTSSRTSGLLLDVEEGAEVRFYLEGSYLATIIGGNNEIVPWAHDGLVDRLEIECNGTCAIDDLMICRPPPVPAVPLWILALAALVSLSAAAWWLEVRRG